MIWPLAKCHFFGLKDWHFWQKWPFSDHKKWHFEWPNQNSKTTFIVQTFPKYGPYGFDLVNLSLLGAILGKFQFCWFSGLFWVFFPCKKNQKWNRIFAAEEVLKSKKWRKQTHIKIQFYNRKKGDQLRFLNFLALSTYLTEPYPT